MLLCVRARLKGSTAEVSKLLQSGSSCALSAQSVNTRLMGRKAGDPHSFRTGQPICIVRKRLIPHPAFRISDPPTATIPRSNRPQIAKHARYSRWQSKSYYSSVTILLCPNASSTTHHSSSSSRSVMSINSACLFSGDSSATTLLSSDPTEIALSPRPCFSWISRTYPSILALYPR